MKENKQTDIEQPFSFWRNVVDKQRKTIAQLQEAISCLKQQVASLGRVNNVLQQQQIEMQKPTVTEQRYRRLTKMLLAKEGQLKQTLVEHCELINVIQWLASERSSLAAENTLLRESLLKVRQQPNPMVRRSSGKGPTLFNKRKREDITRAENLQPKKKRKIQGNGNVGKPTSGFSPRPQTPNGTSNLNRGDKPAIFSKFSRLNTLAWHAKNLLTEPPVTEEEIEKMDHLERFSNS